VSSDASARRGRPRRHADPHGPTREWLDDLPPTALYIAEVARRLVNEHGMDALTIENVALEAHVDPATVRRQFVSKAGLLQVVWDRLEVEPWQELVDRVKDVEPLEARVHAYVAGLGDLIADPLVAVALVELATYGFRDPIVREKMAIDYEMARDSTLEVWRLAPRDADDDARLRTLVSLIVAVIDGLALQVATDPEGTDRDAVFAMLADMVATELRRRDS